MELGYAGVFAGQVLLGSAQRLVELVYLGALIEQAGVEAGFVARFFLLQGQLFSLQLVARFRELGVLLLQRGNLFLVAARQG